MRLLTPKAIEGYASVLDYEACMLVRSLYNGAKQGEVPIDPAKLAGRYVIKSVILFKLSKRNEKLKLC
jgi:hypothetical protein